MDDPKITPEQEIHELPAEANQGISGKDMKINELRQNGYNTPLKYEVRQILNTSAQKLIQEEMSSNQPKTDKESLKEQYFSCLDREILGFLNKNAAEILEVKGSPNNQSLPTITIKKEGAWKELCKIARIKDKAGRNFKDRISGKIKPHNSVRLILTALYGKKYQGINPKKEQIEYSFDEEALPGISNLTPGKFSKLLSKRTVKQFNAIARGNNNFLQQPDISETIERAIKTIEKQDYEYLYNALSTQSNRLVVKMDDLEHIMDKNTERIERWKEEGKKNTAKIKQNRLELKKIEDNIEILEGKKEQIEREVQKFTKERDNWEAMIVALESEEKKEYIEEAILVDYDPLIKIKEEEIAATKRQITALSVQTLSYKSTLGMLEDGHEEELKSLEQEHLDLKENFVKELTEIESTATKIVGDLEGLEKQQVILRELSDKEEKEKQYGFEKGIIRTHIKNIEDSIIELDKRYITKNKYELLAIKKLERQAKDVLALTKQETPQEMSVRLDALDKQIAQLLNSIEIIYDSKTQIFYTQLDSGKVKNIQSLLNTRGMVGIPLANIEHNALNAVKLSMFYGIDALKENSIMPEPSWIEAITRFLINISIKLGFISPPELARGLSSGGMSYLDSETLNAVLKPTLWHAKHPSKKQQDGAVQEVEPILEKQETSSQKKQEDKTTNKRLPGESWTEHLDNTRNSDRNNNYKSPSTLVK